MEAYKELIQAMIKKQIVILGSVAVIKHCRMVSGLSIDDAGNLQSISGDGKKIVADLIAEFIKVSGAVSTMFFKQGAQEVLKKYPSLDVPDQLK